MHPACPDVLTYALGVIAALLRVQDPGANAEVARRGPEGGRPAWLSESGGLVPFRTDNEVHKELLRKFRVGCRIDHEIRQARGQMGRAAAAVEKHPDHSFTRSKAPETLFKRLKHIE